MPDVDGFLRTLWNNPKFGLFSAPKFYKSIRKQYPDIKITLKQVKAFIDKQEAAQVNKRPPKPVFNPIISPAPNVGWQADLLDFQKYRTANKGYKWLLVVIDIYSRRAWFIPVKTKGSKDMAEAFAKLLKKYARPSTAVPVRNLTTDNGKEFTNKEVQKVLKQYDVKHWMHEPGDHNVMGIVERMNRTIRTLLSKWWTMQNTFQWFNIIDHVQHNYNNSEHRGIKAIPLDVYEGRAIPTFAKRKAPQQFKVGDRVRKIINRTVFGKPVETFSKTIYTILKDNGKSYVLQPEGGEPLKAPAKPGQLQLITVVETAKAFATAKDRVTQADTKKAISKQKIELLHKQLNIKPENIVKGKRVRKKKVIVDV
jgi:hypothetical protein